MKSRSVFAIARSAHGRPRARAASTPGADPLSCAFVSPRVPALLALLSLSPLACARGERYGASEGSGQITGASVSVSASDSDDETDSDGSGPSSVSATGPWTSGSQSTTAPPTTDDPSWSSSGDPTWSTSDDATTWDPTDGSTTGDPGSTTDPGCDGPCDAPPGPCHEAVGVCVNGECEYTPKDAGTPCDDGDGCSMGDTCDEGGACDGLPIDCTRPNAKGGSCQGGACQGWTCEAPYENCDDDWDNGCEVPTKVANQCDANGLNPNGGCWTAYCGSSNHADATNFGTFYCADCSTCHVNGNQVQWCNHTTGNWYPPDAGSCGMYLDKVCPAL